LSPEPATKERATPRYRPMLTTKEREMKEKWLAVQTSSGRNRNEKTREKN
jgi:hypothetical protein